MFCNHVSCSPNDCITVFLVKIIYIMLLCSAFPYQIDNNPNCYYFEAERWYPIANGSIQHQIRIYDSYEPGKSSSPRFGFNTEVRLFCYNY